MKKPEMIEAIKNVAASAGKGDLNARDIAVVLDCQRVVVESAVAEGQPVAIHGICKIKTVTCGERLARNPRTGEKVNVPARRAVRIKVSANLKRAAVQEG